MRIFIRFRRGISFFRNLKIGIRLFAGSIKTLTFQHYKYFIFCLLITLIQLARINFTKLVDPNVSISFLVTETLIGESFFEILFKQPISMQYLYKFLLYFFETLLLTFISVWISIYTLEKHSFKKSFVSSKYKLKNITIWTSIEASSALLPAIFGLLGDIFLFIWQIGTSLAIALIAFENFNIFKVIKKSLARFKQSFGNIVGIDVFADILLTIIIYFGYITLEKKFISMNFATQHNFSTSNLYIIFYILSVVYLAQIITFANLYTIIYQKNN